MRLLNRHKGYHLIVDHLERKGHDRQTAVSAVFVLDLLQMVGFKFTHTGAVYDPQVRYLEPYHFYIRPALQEQEGFEELVQEAIRLWVEADWDHLRYQMLNLEQMARKYGDPGSL